MQNTDVTLSNGGGSDLRWTAAGTIIREPGGRDANTREVRNVDGSVKPAGPRRDNAGDVLARFTWNRVGQWNYKSAAWDYNDDLLFLGSYSPNWMAVVDPNNNYQTIRDWNPNGNCMGIA